MGHLKVSEMLTSPNRGSKIDLLSARSLHGRSNDPCVVG